MSNYCIYFHINLNKNTIFYVGRGKIASDKNKHRRPFSKRNRNEFWKNTVNKYDYEVEIIHSNLSFEEANRLEIHYINMIGRRDLGFGPLVNLCDGGKGTDNISEHTRKKLSVTKIGANNPNFNKKLPQHVVESMKIRSTGSNNPFYGKRHSVELMEQINKSNLKHFEKRKSDRIALVKQDYKDVLTLNEKEAIKVLNISKSSYYRYKKILIESQHIK